MKNTVDQSIRAQSGDSGGEHGARGKETGTGILTGHPHLPRVPCPAERNRVVRLVRVHDDQDHRLSDLSRCQARRPLLTSVNSASGPKKQLQRPKRDAMFGIG
jgi:hypothetical protein